MLKIENVNAGYADVTVLWDINLELAEGKTLAIVGSNGAGKSTIMRTLCGLVTPSTGSITFDGKNITKMASHDIVKLGIVYVPEGRRLFNKLSVMDNLLVGSYLPQNRKARAQNLERVFDMFPKLHERREQKAGTLSGGEQQMLAIARGLMACPKVLMLDEPSLGIAPVIVDKLFEIIAELKKQKFADFKDYFKEQELIFKGKLLRLDALFLGENEAVILDFKSSVNAAKNSNEQMKLYKNAVEAIYKKQATAYFVTFRVDECYLKPLKF